MGFWLSFDGLACSENSASRLQPFWMSSAPQALLCIANEHLITFVYICRMLIGKNGKTAKLSVRTEDALLCSML